MSFKRDGDDVAALNCQRKRRVEDLLYEDIGHEELAKLSNGKFVCKLCPHRPIFDTVNMFYVHKQGKKHVASMQHEAVQKQEIADLIQKRKHGTMSELEVRDEEKSRVLGQTNKKQKTRPFRRKEVVDLEVERSDATKTTALEQLPGNRGSNSKVHNEAQESGIKEVKTNANCSKLANNIGSQGIVSNRTDVNKGMIYKHDSDGIVERKNLGKIIGDAQLDNKHKFYLARRKQKSEMTSDIMKQSQGSVKANSDAELITPYQTWDYYKNLKGGHVKVGVSKCSMEVKISGHSEDGQKKEKTCDKSNLAQCGTKEVLDASKGEYAKKMLHAFGSGWKKDWRGQWIKDEDAEFDTDEEAPDL